MKTEGKSFFQALGSMTALWAGLSGGALIAFLTQTLLARSLPIIDFGAFSAAMALVVTIAPLAGAGMGAFWLRCFGEEGWNGRRWVRPSLRVVAGGTAFFGLAALGLGFLAWGRSQQTLLLFLLLPILPLQAFLELATAQLQLEDRYGFLAFWQNLPRLGRFLVAGSVFLFGWPVAAVAGGYCAASLMTLPLLGHQILGMLRGQLQLAGHTRPTTEPLPLPAPTYGTAFRGGWPFAVGGFFSLGYFQGGVFLVSLLAGNRAAALLNVALAILMAIYLLPNAVVNQYLLPKLHRWAAQDRNRFLEAYRVCNGVLLLAGTGIAVLVVPLAPFLLPLIFGEPYREAAAVLQILAVCLPLRFLGTSVGATLCTGENIRYKVRYQAEAALVNLLLLGVLVPTMGVLGAALAILVGEAALLGLYLWGARRHVFGAAAWQGWRFLPRNLHV